MIITEKVNLDCSDVVGPQSYKLRGCGVEFFVEGVDAIFSAGMKQISQHRTPASLSAHQAWLLRFQAHDQVLNYYCSNVYMDIALIRLPPNLEGLTSSAGPSSSTVSTPSIADDAAS